MKLGFRQLLFGILLGVLLYGGVVAYSGLQRIQTVLGDHQDGVVASATLRRLALTAGTTAGENGFTYGLLYAREQQAAETARRQVRKLVD